VSHGKDFELQEEIRGRQAGSSCMNSLGKANKNWNLASWQADHRQRRFFNSRRSERTCTFRL